MNLGVDKVYVINLKEHALRRKRINHNFNKLNIDFEFVEGINWKSYKDNFEELHGYLNEDFYDPNGWFSYGIICCALSHRKAYKQFLDSGKETALFFEDDVKTTKYFNNFDFLQLEKDLNTIDWGVCFLGKYYKDIKVNKHIKNDLYEYSHFEETQFAAHAYILNRKSAQWLYNNTKIINYPADLRLEICPFNLVSTKNSLFVQRHKELLSNVPQIENKREYFWEFFHHTTGDIPVDDVLSFNEKYRETRCKRYVYHPNLPIKNVITKKKILKYKVLEGIKFELNG